MRRPKALVLGVLPLVYMCVTSLSYAYASSMNSNSARARTGLAMAVIVRRRKAATAGAPTKGQGDGGRDRQPDDVLEGDSFGPASIETETESNAYGGSNVTTQSYGRTNTTTTVGAVSTLSTATRTLAPTPTKPSHSGTGTNGTAASTTEPRGSSSTASGATGPGVDPATLSPASEPEPNSVCAQGTPDWSETVEHCGQTVEAKRCTCADDVWACVPVDYDFACGNGGGAPDGGGTSIGVVVGGVIGGIAVVLLVGVAIYRVMFVRKVDSMGTMIHSFSVNSGTISNRAFAFNANDDEDALLGGLSSTA